MKGDTQVGKIVALFRSLPTRPIASTFLGPHPPWDPRGATGGRPTTGPLTPEDVPDVASFYLSTPHPCRLTVTGAARTPTLLCPVEVNGAHQTLQIAPGSTISPA